MSDIKDTRPEAEQQQDAQACENQVTTRPPAQEVPPGSRRNPRPFKTLRNRRRSRLRSRRQKAGRSHPVPAHAIPCLQVWPLLDPSPCCSFWAAWPGPCSGIQARAFTARRNSKALRLFCTALPNSHGSPQPALKTALSARPNGRSSTSGSVFSPLSPALQTAACFCRQPHSQRHFSQHSLSGRLQSPPASVARPPSPRA